MSDSTAHRVQSTPTLYSGPTVANLAAIPAVLKARDQWVLWLWREKPDEPGSGKLAKVPINPSRLNAASSTDALTWGPFDYCVQALPTAREEWELSPPPCYQGAGLGYVTTQDDPYVGVDLDDCVDETTGAIAPWAQEYVDRLNSYTEVTPSSKGLRIWVEADLPPGHNRKGQVEMYSNGRFFTVTGWHLPESPATIEPRQKPLQGLWAKLFGPRIGAQVNCLDTHGNITNKTLLTITVIEDAPDGDVYARFAESQTGWPLVRCEVAPTPVTQAPPTPAMPDAQILAKASQAKNKQKFAALWAGDWQSLGYRSQSEADFALCGILRFWTRDPSQIDQLFRQSQLMRPKWDEKHGAMTYGELTIRASLSTPSEHYTPPPELIVTRTSSNGIAPQPAAASADVPLPYSDYTNALAFVRDHGQQLHYCYPWKAWLIWSGTHWQRDTSGHVMWLAKQTVKRLAGHAEALDDDAKVRALMAHVKSSLSTAKLKALVECAQSEEGIPVQPDELDTDPWALNCLNGTLDLRTGTLRPHQQTDMLTKCLPMPYDEHATCPQWLDFLEKIMQGSTELMTFLQRALGYSLTGSTQEQCFFLLHGPTKTGKSTFMHIAKALLGPYDTQAEMSTFLHKERETVRNDLADLAGMRLVCAIETDAGKRLAEALIKQLTGGTDTIKARFLFEEYFEYRPQFKVFLATNHKPKVNPTDDALWERVHLIPFTVQIPVADRDKHLETKLRQELPGILAWAVQGSLAWQQDDNLRVPPAVVHATQQYRDDMDEIGRFLHEVCVLGDPATYKTQASVLLKAYHQWCGQTTLTGKDFAQYLTDKGYSSKHLQTGNFWLGIGVPSGMNSI